MSASTDGGQGTARSASPRGKSGGKIRLDPQREKGCGKKRPKGGEFPQLKRICPHKKATSSTRLYSRKVLYSRKEVIPLKKKEVVASGKRGGGGRIRRKKEKTRVMYGLSRAAAKKKIPQGKGGNRRGSPRGKASPRLGEGKGGNAC